MAAIALKRGSFSSASGSSDFGGSHGGFGGGGIGGPSILNGGPGGAPGAGLYGTPTLDALGYQQTPKRRQSFVRNESTSTIGDDLSLVGECDVSSTRSDKHRPGRRASLSAAIELTRSPPPKQRVTPKRAASNTRPRGRRSSLFGNSGGGSSKVERDANSSAGDALAKLASKKSSRRASMAGYPAAAKNTTIAEPEPTPQFFQSRKKDKNSRGLPTRRKSSSFDKNDPRAVRITSQLRPGEKIKRPGKGGRRASMSAVPILGGLSKSGSKSSVGSSKGSQRSLFSSNSNNSSSYEISDDEDYYGVSNNNKKNNKATKRDSNVAPFKRNMTAPTPQRTTSYGTATTRQRKKKNEMADLGYGDPEQYDPQLPPPPPPGTNKPPPRSVFSSRRGSTGTVVSSFPTNSAAQRSLKESLQWKAATSAGRNSLVPRRGSTASRSSAATSVATDVVNNTQTSRRVPADVPPQRRVPADVPPLRMPDDDEPMTPQQGEKLKLSALGSPTTPLRSDEDSSDSSYDHHVRGTPIQSNLTTKSLMQDSHNLSLMGNTSSALGSLMSDESDGSHGDGSISGGIPMMAMKRANRGLAVLQKPGPAGAAAGMSQSSLHGVGSPMGGFNPYGTNRSRDSDDEEEEEEEEEEENNTLEKGSNEEHLKSADSGSETNSATGETMATETVATSATTVGSTTDSAPTLTVTEDSDNNKGEHGNEDESDQGSMTSEAPQEKAPEIDVDEYAEKHNMDDQMEEIGASGDWSQGVVDHMLKKEETVTKSLLERYPGSDYEYDPAVGDLLGYGGYSHLETQQHKIMDAYDDESERKDEYDFDNGYGPSDLYDEDYSSFGWREHRPRTADSIEFINMEQLMSKAKNTKGLYLPTFIPAHGCTNASDFIVRCFVARLRAGMTVTKHSRSRFCKSHDRILHILPTGYHITWIPETEEEAVEKSKKKPPTKLDLTKCLEVRHAWSRDPKSMKYTGTSTLRSKCKEGAANRSFALIYAHRTVDFTAMTVDQCKILMEGFSALCFRLQMARLEQQADGDDDTTQHTVSVVEHDNDSTTASLTGTNMSAPWGL